MPFIYERNNFTLRTKTQGLFLQRKLVQVCKLPVMEVVESFVGQELCGSVVEVRIELVDHALITKNGEKTDRES